MNDGVNAIQNILYENPGPKAKRRVAIGTGISAVLVIFLLAWIVKLFYDNGQLSGRYWSFFARATTWRFLGQGLLGTIEAAIVAAAIAFLLGFLYMLARISKFKILSAIGTVLIEFTRGVPTLLFIYFFFLVVPQLGINLPSLLRIALPVAISASGTVAEILRSGINSVPKGQSEAALSLGMTNGQTFYKIVFPQAFRYVIPSLVADLVIVLKDTTFAYVVNFPDLMQNARVLISNYDAMLSVYLVIAIIYIIINYLLNKLSIFAALKTGKGGSNVTDSSY